MSRKWKPLLDQSTHEAATQLAGEYLDAAARGLARLENPADPRGLHAFRVSIRRLRSLLRAYQPWLGRVAGRKVGRRLRDLTRDTSSGRDAEVQIDWLETQRAALARDELPGFNRLLRQPSACKRRAYRSAGAQLGRDLTGVVELMRKRMADGDSPEPVAFREGIAELLDPAVAEFRQRLAAISGAGDVENVHRARVQVKRLRYLVEPLRAELAEARAVLQPLKNLQKQLGELHDMHVLDEVLAAAIEETAAEKARRLHRIAVAGGMKALARTRRRDEGLGLLTLATRAGERREALHAKFEREWLLARISPLRKELNAFAKRVNAARALAVKPV